jgi:BrnA antitoxin of type II toxin-antitoxin system
MNHRRGLQRLYAVGSAVYVILVLAAEPTERLDSDLLAWLRRENGYQTRINAVLRTYMEAQK